MARTRANIISTLFSTFFFFRVEACYLFGPFCISDVPTAIENHLFKNKIRVSMSTGQQHIVGMVTHVQLIGK